MSPPRQDQMDARYKSEFSNYPDFELEIQGTEMLMLDPHLAKKAM